MHIVFLTITFPIVNGQSTDGSAMFVSNMASIMQKNGHRVTVITESKSKEIIYWNGIEIRKINATIGFKDDGKPMPTYKKLLKNIWRSVWYNWEVFKVDKINKVDIVQSINSYGLSMLRLRKIPYIVFVAEFPPLWRLSRKESYDYEACLNSKRLDEEVSFEGIKRADKITLPSYLMQKLIYNKTLKESEVIETPVIIENRDNLKLNEDNLEKGKYIVTYGGMHYRKEIHILVQLIDRILDEFSNMKYVMVGMDDRIFADNRYMSISEYFKLHITRNYDRFVYLGEISDRQRLFSIIKNASICVLPTRIDNLPNTVVESMTLGKVVVSSTSEHGTSVEQLITDGYNGFLAQVDDVEDLYNKIVYALNLPENEKEVIGSRASDRVKKSTPENVYEKMMKIYIETINKKKGSVQ